MSPDDKILVWLAGEVKSPPFSDEARLEAGFLLRRLQQGETLATSFAAHAVDRRRMSRAQDRRPGRDLEDHVLRRYRRRRLDVFKKKTRATPKKVIETCTQRLRAYRSVRDR